MTVDFELRPGIVLRVPEEAVHGFTWFTKVSPECIAEMDLFPIWAKGRRYFMDIGAYHGMFSIVFAHINPNGGVAVAFEPSDIVRPVLEHAADAYKGRILASKLALSDQAGEMVARTEFQTHVVLSPGNLPGTNCTGPSDPPQTIRRVVGDALGFNPDVIKIDVEGHEVRVVRGMIETIKRNKPTIFIELHGLRIVDDGESMQALVDMLGPLDYVVVEQPHGEALGMDHLLTYPVGSQIQRVMLIHSANFCTD